jgi:hypothetical protein
MALPALLPRSNKSVVPRLRLGLSSVRGYARAASYAEVRLLRLSQHVSHFFPGCLIHCEKAVCKLPNSRTRLFFHIMHIRTILVGADVLSSYRILLIHLVLQMPFPLLQHLQL